MATIDQVFALAEAIGIRWRLMVLLGAFASMRPEELAELRRADIDLDTGSVRVRWAAPERNTGRRVIGDPKSRAGKREITLPGFVLLDVRWHLEWFAQPGPDGLVLVGEKSAALRGTTFGHKWRKARDAVGMPKEFRFYDLRHTGNTLAADTGAKLTPTSTSSCPRIPAPPGAARRRRAGDVLLVRIDWSGGTGATPSTPPGPWVKRRRPREGGRRGRGVKCPIGEATAVVRSIGSPGCHSTKAARISLGG